MIIAFIGLRLAFGQRVWLPALLLEKKVPLKLLKKISSIVERVTHALRFAIHTRLVWLVRTPSLHILHGVVIAILGILLALPLPIPMTNMLTALPILAFGVGLLEEDGLLIIIAYLLALLAFGMFMALIWLGGKGISFLIF